MLRAPCQRLVCSVLGLNSFGSSSSSSSTAQPLLAATLSSWPAQQQAAPTQHAAGSRCSINSRAYSSDAAADYTEEVDVINEKFVEAREEIEYAREDAETVYFNESAEIARKAVGGVLERWTALLGRLPEDEQAKLQRSMGLKIEQLKAELKELDELHA